MKIYEKEILNLIFTQQVELVSPVVLIKTIQILDIPKEGSDDIDIKSDLEGSNFTTIIIHRN